MGKNIKKPSKKTVSVPQIMQLETLECGAACLTMVLAYYGKWIPLERIREACGVSRDGSNAGNILKAAIHYGLKATAFSLDFDELKTEVTFPCILHWNFNHFVVLCGISGKKAYINDPARGSYSMPLDKLDENFTGITLCFEPDEGFEPSGHKKSMLSFAQKRLKGTTAAILFMAVTSVVGALISLIAPAFSRVFIDRLVGNPDHPWFSVFVAALAVFSLLRVLILAVQSVYNLRISGKMASIGSASYLFKVLHMPMSFFSQRMAGDIQERQSANATVANALINIVAPLALNAVMMIVYVIVMIRYSLLLAAVGIVSVLANTLVCAWVSKKRVNITRVSMRDTAKMNSTVVSGIEMIETVKASGAENGFFSKWSGYQASVNAQEVKYIKLNGCLGMVPALLVSLADALVLILGVMLTMQGNMTIGMVLAFQGILALFTSPAQMLISSGQTLQEMRTLMERVEDVMEYPEDKVFSEDDDEVAEEKLSGRIEMRDVYFGYSPLGEPVISNFNMTVEPGKTVAIVGASGCGKSTVSKLVSGLYKQWSGDILFDGKPLSEISKSVFYGSVAVVDQDITLFEDTVANNIKMWDSSIEDFEMILAARDAFLYDEIMQRPDGFNYKITENGKNFSGGQRQRMEIARVLAQDPTVIVLDEATSSLDAKTEYNVVKAIKNRGITCVVVAHRLSTIRSCDEIIVLDNGKIADKGTHDELMQKCGLYRELVINE